MGPTLEIRHCQGRYNDEKLVQACKAGNWIDGPGKAATTHLRPGGHAVWRTHPATSSASSHTACMEEGQTQTPHSAYTPWGREHPMDRMTCTLEK